MPNTVNISNPQKSWWPGDPRVEEFMPPVLEAIKRHEPPLNREAEIDIYNRAYEAVFAAISKYAPKEEQ